VRVIGGADGGLSPPAIRRDQAGFWYSQGLSLL